MNGSGKFEVYEDKSGNWRWRLKTISGEIVATAESAFETKAAAKKGCESVQIAAGSPVDGINIVEV